MLQFLLAGASHADDLLFIFNVDLPVILCDLQNFLTGLSNAWLQCLLDGNILDAVDCVTAHDGEFKVSSPLEASSVTDCQALT